MRCRTASDAAAREIQVCITATSHCTHGFSTICLMFTRQNLNICCAKEPTGSPHPIYREHGRFSAAAAKNRTSPSGKRRTANRVHGHQALLYMYSDRTMIYENCNRHFAIWNVLL